MLFTRYPLSHIFVVLVSTFALFAVMFAMAMPAFAASDLSAKMDALEPLELHITTNESEPLLDEKAVAKFQKYITKLRGSLSSANSNFEQGRYKKSGKLFASAAAQIEKSDKPDYLKLFAIHYSAAYSYYLSGNMAATIFHVNKALDDLGQYRGRGKGDLQTDASEAEAVQAKGVRRAEMEAYYILGDALIAQGQSNQGQQALRASVALADEIGEEPFARSVNWRLYQEQAAHGKEQEALLTLNKSLEYYQRDKNDFMIATTLYQKGVIQLGNNGYSASYRSFSNAISIAKNHGYLELLGRSYMGLSESSLGIGSYYNAALNLENAIDIVVSAEMSDAYLPSSRKLINIYRLIGEYEKALYISDKRVQFAIERQNTTLEAQLYLEKGDTYQYINDLHNATLLYIAAVNVIKQAPETTKENREENRKTLGDTYYKLAMAYGEIGNNAKTETYALEATVALDDLGDSRATEVYTLLGDTYMNLHLYAQASQQFETSLKRSKQHSQPNQQAYIYKQIGLSYKARGDAKTSIALLENSLSLSQDFQATTALGALYTLEGRLQEGASMLSQAVDYYNTTTNKEMQSNSRYNYAVAELKRGNYDDAMTNLRVAHTIDIAQNNQVKIAQDLYTKGAIQYYSDAFADSITNANSATTIIETLMGESNATVGDGYKTAIRQIQHLKIASAIKNNDIETALRAGEYLNLIDLPQGYVGFNLKTLQLALNSSEIMFAVLPADVNTQDGVLDTAVITITRTNALGQIVPIPLKNLKSDRIKTELQPLIAEQLSSPTPYRFDYPYTDIAIGARIINNQDNKHNNAFLYQQLIEPYQNTNQLANKVIWFYSVSIYSQIDFEMLQNANGTLLAQQNRIVYTPAITPTGSMPEYVSSRKQANQTIVIAAKGKPNKIKRFNIENVSTYLHALDEATRTSPATNYFGSEINLGSLYNSLQHEKKQSNEKILPPKITTAGLNRYVPSQRLATIASKDSTLPEGSNITVLTGFSPMNNPQEYPFINTVILNQCREFNGGNMLSYVETTSEEWSNNKKQTKITTQHFMRYNELAALALGGNTVVMPNCQDTPNFRLNMGNAKVIPIALYFAQASTILRNIGDADQNSRVFLYQYMYQAFQEGQNGVDALHTVQQRYMNGALGENLVTPQNWNKFRVYANIYR